MKKLFSSISKIDILLILFLSLTPLLWFKGNFLIVGHDNVFPLIPTEFLNGRLFTWIDQGFGQPQNLIIGTIAIHLIDAIPYLFGLGIQKTEEIVYIFWFFAMGLSIYTLASVINRESRVFKLTATVLYLFNFFILQGWWIGERTKFSAYCALPLVIAVFIKVYRKELGVVKGAIINSLILLIFNGGGLYGTALFGGYFLSLGVFVLFFSALSFFRKEKGVIQRFLSLIALSSVGYILVNAYFILPTIPTIYKQYISGVQAVGGASGLVDWASEISAYASYSNIFRLQGIPEWYDNRFHPFAAYFQHNQLLVLGSFIWPILAFLPIFLYKFRQKTENTLYFFLLYLLSVVFVAGTHPPLGFIYTFFIQHVPGFIIFRSPYYKFAPALFLASSFLIAYSIDFLRGKTKQVVFVLFMLFVLVYHFPFFTVNIFSFRPGFSTRNEIPSYIFEFGKWLNKEKPDDGRILILPPNDPNLRYGTYNWGYLSYQSITTLLSNKSVVINNDRIGKEEEILLKDLYQAIGNNNRFLSDKLFSILGIKYVLIQNDKTLNSPFFPSKDSYKKFIASDSELVRTFGKWEIYRLSLNSGSMFTIANAVNVLYGKVDDFNTYLSQSPSLSVALKSDIERNDKIPISQFYIPDCINCPNDKNRPPISFSDTTILPGSPFYPLVLLKEKLTSAKDPKGKVYDDIGLSLKRINEVREVGLRDGTINDSILKQLEDLFNKTTSDFNKLLNIEDKIQLADDLDYYMRSERAYILKVENSLNPGNPVTLDFAKVDRLISVFLRSIDTYIYKLDPANNRLYKFTVDGNTQSEILLGKSGLNAVLNEGSTVRMDLDGKLLKEIKLNSAYLSSPWISFGRNTITKGVHYISLSFPKSPNLATALKPGAVDFSIYDQNNCFISKINNYTDRRLYKVTLDYKNDFTIDLLFYIWEQKGNSKKLVNLARLSPAITNQEYYQYERAPGDSSELWVGLCSGGLNSEVITSKINLNAEEILFPAIIVSPAVKQNPLIEEIEYKRKSPTEYSIFVPKHNGKIILTFLNHFDPEWKLSSFENTHFKNQMYANSWILDKGGDTTLTLEYTPQRFFIAGVAVSSISIFLGLMCLARKKSKNS